MNQMPTGQNVLVQLTDFNVTTHAPKTKEISMSQDTASAEQSAAPAADTNEFVAVPGRTLSNGIVVAPFLIGKYMTRFNADGTATINADAVPTVRINHDDSLSKCKSAGLSMLTLSQSAALALDVAEQAANWSGGEVGKGNLLQGLHRGTVSGTVDGNYVSKHENERRGFVLSNGEIVHDVAGHLYARLFDDVHGDERGLVAIKSLPADSPAVFAPYPGGKQGVGYRCDAGDDLSGGALIRGGCWYSGGCAGVFRVVGAWPVSVCDFVGVRCTKQVP